MGTKSEKLEIGIFNGEMGTITKINSLTETIEASFERKKCSIWF